MAITGGVGAGGGEGLAEGPGAADAEGLGEGAALDAACAPRSRSNARTGMDFISTAGDVGGRRRDVNELMIPALV